MVAIVRVPRPGFNLQATKEKTTQRHIPINEYFSQTSEYLYNVKYAYVHQRNAWYEAV